MDNRRAAEYEDKLIAGIRKAIEASGKTAEQVAYEAGLGKSGLSKILLRKRSPRLITLIKLAYGLERPIVIDPPADG